MNLFVVSIVGRDASENTDHVQSRIIAHNKGEAHKTAITQFVARHPEDFVVSVLIDDIGPCKFTARKQEGQ